MEKARPDEFDFYEALTSAVLFVKANLAVFIVSILIGVSSCILQMKMRPKSYSGDMIVTSRIATAPFCDHMLQHLNILIEDSEFDSLSRELQLPLARVKAIKNIAVDGVGRSLLIHGDTTFRIRVSVRDKSFTSALQNAIVHYIETDRYVLGQRAVHAVNVVGDLAVVRKLSPLDKPLIATALGFIAGVILAFAYLAIRLILRIAKS